MNKAVSAEQPAELDRYFSVMIQEKLHSSKGRLQFYLSRLFEDISFENKTFMDVGAGMGLFSFYAACMGAKEVLCLEPEAEGSDEYVRARFRKVLSHLSFLDQVKLDHSTIQSFEPCGKKFDVILLHGSVNHLDEDACIHLLCDENSRNSYRAIFSKINSMANIGAKIIIYDCSRYNFFSLLGIKNPFASDIEWHKHQSPNLWAELLSEAGFCNPKIKWHSFSVLGSLGKLFLGNRFVSYFFSSHYYLRMEKAL